MTGAIKDTEKKLRSPAKARRLEAEIAAATTPPVAISAEPPIAADAVLVEAPAPLADAPVAAAAIEPPPLATPAEPERSQADVDHPPTNPTDTPKAKENIMATAFETTKETATDAARATVSQFNDSAEAAMNTGKEAMEKISAQAKEAAETSMKSIEEMTDLARGNVEAMLASARLAAAGFETLAAHISEVSRKSFESTTAAARAMTSAKTPNEMFQLQSDFAKTQFDQAVSEFSKMTEMMVKLSGEVMEPVQNRMAVATDKMKSAFTK